MNKEDEERIAREIRLGRKFSMAEAIGREGGGFLKGASPVGRLQQVELEIRSLLEKQLNDSNGALFAVLYRQIKEADLLLSRHLDNPAAALYEFTQRILDNAHLLHDLVREVDAQWGRMFEERPYFDLPGSEPDAEDPYTVEDVRKKLENLAQRIRDSANPRSEM